MKVRANVQFTGTTSIVLDTDDYPHYFANNEARGGLPQLVEDVFYDEAEFHGAPFEAGATEIREAWFDEAEEVR